MRLFKVSLLSIIFGVWCVILFGTHPGFIQWCLITGLNLDNLKILVDKIGFIDDDDDQGGILVKNNV